MGRHSRGSNGSKPDWSKTEKAWANLLHREIFETGRYFRKCELNQFKSKPKHFNRKKNRESSEEDEGFEDGTSSKPYVKMVQLSSREYLDQLNQLISQLEERVTLVSEEIASLEGVDKKAEELQVRVSRLSQALNNIRVWHQDDQETEQKLTELRSDIESVSSSARDLAVTTRRSMSDLGQSLPPDTGEKLSGLELGAEQCVQMLEEKEQEHKRARTVRYDFQVDVEEVQFWISRSESKIQDRSLDPHMLKTNLNEIQSEITGISEQLENLLANGKIISEKTECSQEKELILSTTANLSEQLNQLKQLIQDKKNAANDAIDSWQRFLQFHVAVTSWCEEKEAFLTEPFTFTNLSAARLKLQDYTTALKSIKNVTKNIGEMERELKKISSVGNSGDLAEKLLDVETKKGDLEAHLMEKNAVLSEMTEEWDQCEKKLKEAKAWVGKARESLESLTNKKRPLRDQLALRDKMSSDIRVQSKRVTMALEKLKVHLREEVTKEQDIQKLGRSIEGELNQLGEEVKASSSTLEASLAQLEQYQTTISGLRQSILACEGELRTVSSPAYTARDRDRALAEQSVDLASLEAGVSRIEETLQMLTEEQLSGQLAVIKYTLTTLGDLEKDSQEMEGRLGKESGSATNDIQSLAATLSSCRTKIVTLNTEAEATRARIESYMGERKKRVAEIKRYQALLVDLEQWVGETQSSISSEIKLTSAKVVRDQIRASQSLEADLRYRSDQLDHLIVEVERLRSYVDVQSLVSEMMENLNCLREVIKEAQQCLAQRLGTLQVCCT